MRAATIFPAAFAVLISAGSAIAAPVTASELLNAYNLIVFGDVNSASHVDGKAYIGGNANGGEYNNHNVSAGAGLPALTVGKNLTGNVNINGAGGIAIGGNFATSNYNGNGAGSAYIGGSWTGNGNFNLNGSGNVYLGGIKTGSGNINGGALFQNQNSPSFLAKIPTVATISAIQNPLIGYSGFLDSLSANSTVSIASGKATFNAAPDANGVAVFDIFNAIAFFNSITEIEFNKNGAKEIIVNVSGAFSNLLTIAENFLGGSAQARSLDTIWNFTDATNIKIDNQFGGDFLATLATVTLNQNLEGTLVAATLLQNGEIHYNGPNNYLPSPPQPGPSETPIPGALPLFATGLGALALIARRRKKIAA